MRYFILLMLATICLFGADEPKSPGTLIYEKALTENAREAERAFDGYWKVLEMANAKVIKALESAKVDLNDPKKGNLPISERAKAIMELDEKIRAVKEGAISDLLVENKKKMLLANAGAPTKEQTEKVLLGRWKVVKSNGTFSSFWDFQKKGIVTQAGAVGAGTWEIQDKVVRITWNAQAWEEFNLPLNPKGTLFNSWGGGTNCGTATKQ